MIKTSYFRAGDVKRVMEMVDEWLEEAGDIEIVAVGQSEDSYPSRESYITITIFYKER